MRLNEYGYAVPHIRETRSEYVGIMSINGRDHEISPDQVVHLRKIIARNPGSEEHISAKIVKRRVTTERPECSYCAARPVTGEYDCDGFHWNATCDSDQCVKVDVRRGRRNLSASSRARGLDG